MPTGTPSPRPSLQGLLLLGSLLAMMAALSTADSAADWLDLSEFPVSSSQHIHAAALLEHAALLQQTSAESLVHASTC